MFTAIIILLVFATHYILSMPLIYQKMTLGITVFVLCISATVMKGQQELPVMMSPISTANIELGNVHLVTKGKKFMTFCETQHVRSLMTDLTQSHKSVDLENGEGCFT